VADGERGSGGTGRGYLGAGTGSRGGGGRGNRGGRGGWGPADSPADPAGLSRPPALRWLGTLSTRVAVYILLGAALLGVVGTLLTGSEPGGLLNYLIIIGSVVAAIGIRRRGLYLLIPLPALTFFICAVLTGAVKDSSIDTSRTELGVSFLQWIAGVFFAMCAATIIVLLIGAGRWLLSRQLVAGQFGMSANAAQGGAVPRATSAPGQRADRDRRRPTDREPWAAAPWERDDRSGRRANREGDARDPWGDRRQQPGAQPSDRPMPSFQPTDGGQPGTRPQPGGQPANRVPPGGQPADRGQPSDRDQPGGRRAGSGLPDDPAVPSDKDPWTKRDPRNRRGSRESGKQQGTSERPDPRDPWGSR
jgi:hypothetical protein